MWTSDPSHQRRRVYRTHIVNALSPRRGWHPAPRPFIGNPSAVMEWRKSPRLVIDPRIAPGLDIGPVAVMIGSPSRDGRAREPYIAVVGSSAPRAVIV